MTTTDRDNIKYMLTCIVDSDLIKTNIINFKIFTKDLKFF